ncbi:MAG: hypothetical protein RIQ56_87 [Candidatus Parcubacteria bacterium]
MRILGIETSCDETAISLISAEGTFGKDFSYKVEGESLISQSSLHAPYGGVFPNLAKREHGRNLTPLLMETLKRANALVENQPSADEKTIAEVGKMLERETELFAFLADFFRSYGKPDIDAIAVTTGPGLEPALWVGINFAKAISHVWNVPIIPVNHMEGHILIAALGESNLRQFHVPALALLVSGGHTELVLMKEWMQYKLLGETRDDAAGEAFDKCARLLELGYPGGPEISRLAQAARNQNLPKAAALPRPMIHTNDLDFSFAGLKTAVRRQVEGKKLTDDEKKILAREIEDAITEVLVTKTKAAAETSGARTIVVSGGVSANQHLRNQCEQQLESEGFVILFPTPDLSTDNARMIALAGYFHAINEKYTLPQNIIAKGNLRLGAESV